MNTFIRLINRSLNLNIPLRIRQEVEPATVLYPIFPNYKPLRIPRIFNHRDRVKFPSIRRGFPFEFPGIKINRNI
ncbi:hypothetical protein [Sphingobacterium kyonggiense]